MKASSKEGAMKRTPWFALAILLQLGVLAGEYLSSVWPTWKGERVLLRVAPVDPRSWFSGHYARLDYDIASIPRELYGGAEPRLRAGEVVYVALERRDEWWQASALTLEPPEQGVFLRGRLEFPWFGEADLRVRYGIEAWFAPPEEAQAIERSIALDRVPLEPNAPAEERLESGPGSTPEELGPGERSDAGRQPVLAEVAVTSSGRAALVGLDWRRE
jgi:uncharacterized membrane-anchored protein